MRPRHAARARVLRNGIQGCHPGNDEPLPCSPCSCTRKYMARPCPSHTFVRAVGSAGSNRSARRRDPPSRSSARHPGSPS